MKILLSLAFILAALPAAAQDRAGNNTPGEWVVTHHQPFGLWDSMCDERVTGDLKEERCYLRYVDVFSPRPNFAAMFVFLTPGPEFDVGLEAGTLFRENGFRIDRDGASVWADPKPGCLVGLRCNWQGDEAAELLEVMAAGGQFTFDLIDRHGQPHLRVWDLGPFRAALDDFQNEAAKRGL